MAGDLIQVVGSTSTTARLGEERIETSLSAREGARPVPGWTPQVLALPARAEMWRCNVDDSSNVVAMVRQGALALDLSALDLEAIGEQEGDGVAALAFDVVDATFEELVRTDLGTTPASAGPRTAVSDNERGAPNSITGAARSDPKANRARLEARDRHR